MDERRQLAISDGPCAMLAGEYIVEFTPNRMRQKRLEVAPLGPEAGERERPRSLPFGQSVPAGNAAAIGAAESRDREFAEVHARECALKEAISKSFEDRDEDAAFAEQVMLQRFRTVSV